jgi:hypothetical protein
VIAALVKPVLKFGNMQTPRHVKEPALPDHSICLHSNQTVVLNFLLGATRCYLQAGGERYGSHVSSWWLELE